MSPKALASLLLVTAIAVVGAGVLIIREQANADARITASAPMFPALNERADDIARVVIQNRRYRIELVNRGDGQWVAENFGDYPVETGPIAQIVSSLAAMTTVETKTDNPDWYDDIGVDDPADSTTSSGVHITVTDADSVVMADAIVGIVSSSIGARPLGGSFVRRADEATTWLVEGTVAAPGFFQDWFDQIVHIPGPDIASVTILAGDRVLYSAAKVDFTTADYEITEIDPELAPPEAIAVDDVVRNVSQGVVSTAFDDARPRADLVVAPDARTVRFTTRDGMTIDVILGQIDGELWVAYDVSVAEGSEAEAVEEAEEIRSRTADWAFRLPASRNTVLQRPVEDLFTIPPPPPEPQPLQPLLPVLRP